MLFSPVVVVRVLVLIEPYCRVILLAALIASIVFALILPLSAVMVFLVAFALDVPSARMEPTFRVRVVAESVLLCPFLEMIFCAVILAFSVIMISFFELVFLNPGLMPMEVALIVRFLAVIVLEELFSLTVMLASLLAEPMIRVALLASMVFDPLSARMPPMKETASFIVMSLLEPLVAMISPMIWLFPLKVMVLLAFVTVVVVGLRTPAITLPVIFPFSKVAVVCPTWVVRLPSRLAPFLKIKSVLCPF